MAAYAFVVGDIACERCGEVWHDSAAFSWGLCCEGGFNAGLHYRVGDRVRWRSDFDSLPPAFTAFDGPSGMVNHGDPARLDVVVAVDSVTLEGEPCRGCGRQILPIVEVRNGAIDAVVAADVRDRRVQQAKAVEAELQSRSYPTVTWRHGVTDKSLAAVREFLADFELTKIDDIDTSDTDAGDQLARRRREIARALALGPSRFSRRALCHEIGVRSGSDPLLLELQLEALTDEGLGPQ